MPKKFIVGLGNPGKKYERTRHNAGFMALAGLAKELSLDLSKEKHDSLYARAKLEGLQLTLILPQTFMNLSGDAVALWKSKEGFDMEKDLLVVYDDMDLPLGKLRIRPSGSGGSHNGMASLIERLGSGNFNRLRLGIGKPEDPEAWADYVTQKFKPGEKGPLDAMLEKAVSAMRLWLGHASFEKLMSQVNS